MLHALCISPHIVLIMLFQQYLTPSLCAIYAFCFLNLTEVVSFSNRPTSSNRYDFGYFNAHKESIHHNEAIKSCQFQPQKRIPLHLRVHDEILSEDADIDWSADEKEEDGSIPEHSMKDLQLPDPLPTIKILYESDQILAIEKPPHISHHDEKMQNFSEDKAESSTNTGTATMGIISLLRYMQQNDILASPYKGRLYGVHRLDKVTSGILLLAKSKEVAGMLSRSFQDKTVTKYYVALTNKKPKKKKQGWVRGDMKVARRGAWKLIPSTSSKAKGEENMTNSNYAVTRFFTAGLGNCQFEDDAWSDIHTHTDQTKASSISFPRTMILFRPHTGKTHQLRVAAKSLGLPILGDVLYDDANDAKKVRRTYLHAVAMQVLINDENVKIYNPPTSWFEDITDKDSNGGDGNGLRDVLTNLLNKHCDNEGILELLWNDS